MGVDIALLSSKEYIQRMKVLCDVYFPEVNKVLSIKKSDVSSVSNRFECGVFATDNIPADILLGEYVGDIILKKERYESDLTSIQDTLDLLHDDKLFLLAQSKTSNDMLVASCKHKMGWPALVNETCDISKQNVTSLLYIDNNGWPKVIYRSIKPIAKGEELYTFYNAELVKTSLGGAMSL